MKSTHEIIFHAANAASAELLLIGGHALQRYGYARQTLDVDALIVASKVEAMTETLGQAGYNPTASTQSFVRFRHDSVYLMDIDILLIDAHTMQRMMSESEQLTLHGNPFRVPSLLHLVALKLHAISNNPDREQRDLADILELLRLNAASVDAAALKDTVSRFAPESLADKILGGAS